MYKPTNKLVRLLLLPLRIVKRLFIFLVLGAIMGWMLLAGLCARQRKGIC